MNKTDLEMIRCARSAGGHQCAVFRDGKDFYVMYAFAEPYTPQLIKTNEDDAMTLYALFV